MKFVKIFQKEDIILKNDREMSHSKYQNLRKQTMLPILSERRLLHRQVSFYQRGAVPEALTSRDS